MMMIVEVVEHACFVSLLMLGETLSKRGVLRKFLFNVVCLSIRPHPSVDDVSTMERMLVMDKSIEFFIVKPE
ncbi:hypothetical protein KIN20_028081 [Parelaphostrongylus tenuis]|uniref:Uncharacterized protein n=1 Tax=Parelaphostrongylus tenuis TaxID=148309 RepID=A0AAD5R0B5_PARTN|nr:hypothetical protein KIN20_028081 [Parelaphostrongylus tenuis]